MFAYIHKYIYIHIYMLTLRRLIGPKRVDTAGHAAADEPKDDEKEDDAQERLGGGRGLGVRVSDGRCIPGREVLVEGGGLIEHGLHAGDGRCIPRREVLVEGGGAQEHGGLTG